MPSVSIIIPAYNEEKRLPGTLKAISRYISVKRLKAEIIVVDDGSTDSTVQKVQQFKGSKVKLVRNGRNSGKGFSVQNGVKHAKGDVILFTDADLSTPIKHLAEFLQLHKDGSDVVIASRDLSGSKVVVPQNHFRELSGKFFNFMVRAITGLPIHDTQCGFKSFTRKAGKAVFSRQTIPGFGFDAEILYIARKLKFLTTETPVEWYNSPATKVHFLRDSTRMFGGLFKIRINDMMGRYK